MFPETIETGDYGKLTRMDSKLTEWADIKALLEADKQVFFATFWTKRQIKEFGYAQRWEVKVPKDGFPNDLDLLLGVLPCSNVSRLWCMSIYTEAMMFIEDTDLQYVEDNDPRKKDGETFKVRMSAGMEFEIYVPAEEEEATAE